MPQPVIIVGGGPVGLCFAWALVRQGRPVVVVEARDDIARDPRANTLQPTTLQNLAQWDILDELLPLGLKADRLTYWDWTTRQPIGHFEFELLAGETPYPYRLHVPQWELVNILMRRLEASELAQVEMGCTATKLDADNSGVRLTVRRGGEDIVFEGSHLVGADGTHSFVRDALNIGFAYELRPVRFVTFEVSNRFLMSLAEAVGDRPSNINVLLTDHSWAVAMTMRRSVRVLMPESWDPNRAMAELTERDVRRQLRDELELAFEGDIKFRGAYTVHSRIVEHMRLGSVFLAGDAAHSTNPLGGSAMNSGIDDAAMLAAAFADGRPQVLDAYDATRRTAVRKAVAEPADHHYRVVAAMGKWNDLGRNRYLATVAADPERARDHIMRLSMMEDRLTIPPPIMTE